MPSIIDDFREIRKKELLAHVGIDQIAGVDINALLGTVQEEDTTDSIRLIIEMLEPRVPPIDGRLFIKDYLINQYYEYATQEEWMVFDEAWKKGGVLFFDLHDDGKQLHIAYQKNDIQHYDFDKLNAGQFFADHSFSYRVFGEDDVERWSGSHQEIVLRIINLKPFNLGDNKILFGFYTGHNTPILCEFEWASSLDFFWSSFRNAKLIGFALPKTLNALEKSIEFVQHKSLFDLNLAFSLLFNKKEVIKTEEIISYYQLAHWKNGWSVILQEEDLDKRIKMVYLQMASELRNAFLINEFLYSYFINNKAESLLVDLSKHCEALYGVW